MLVRGPSPLLHAVCRASEPLPVVILLVGDYVAWLPGLAQPWWRKCAIGLWARWNRHQQIASCRKHVTLVNSRVLFQQLQPLVPRLFEVRTTTLQRGDFHLREDTCHQRPVRLLYAGRLERAKGLLEMAETIRLLTEMGEDVVLDLVGWAAPGDPIVDEVMEHARKQGVAGKVQYQGFKALGEELFSFYRAADIYVLASTNSEGFPRAIWEAMASCTPVVSTRVGSISDFVVDGNTALLAPPRDPAAMAGAIQRLIHDGELRRHLIQSGYALAETVTLESTTSTIVQHAQHLCQERCGAVPFCVS